jgi:sigma-B regulation protein RsbU (phosphoserine phosphatase)
VTELDALLADPTLGRLIDLASAAAGGVPIALTDTEGRLLAGSPVAAGGEALPVLVDGNTIGHVVCDVTTPTGLAAFVGASLEVAITGARDHATRAREAQELEIGRQIQLSLLPRRFPEVPGWRFAADYEPAREVGGDLYDVFRPRAGGDGVVLLIADVTGKGVPAALLMANTKALLHAAADNADGPADALARVNRILAVERRTVRFVSAALVEVDARSGDVRLASAGHEPPLVIHADGLVEAMEASGPILGAFAEVTHEPGRFQVRPGESVVLYTDGITDARNPDGAFYGEPRLREVLSGLAGASADDVRRAVVDDVRAFRAGADAYDDLTILVAQREVGGA